jgi:predicted dienelactone hydrolase
LPLFGRLRSGILNRCPRRDDKPITYLDTIEQQIPSLRGRINRQRIGVAGHSMGAGTALLVAGARAARPAGVMRSFRDPRVTAAIAMSPQGAGEEGFTDASWNDLRVPVMTMSGTLDLGIAGQPATWRLEPVQRMPPTDKFQVIVDGARHLSFAAGEQFHPCILRETLAFWGSFLKQDALRPRISSYGACAVTSK